MKFWVAFIPHLSTEQIIALYFDEHNPRCDMTRAYVQVETVLHLHITVLTQLIHTL